MYDGVGLNSTDADGNLPLHLACAYGTPEDVNWIWQQLSLPESPVTFKAQLKAANKYGMWPAACAVAAGNCEMVAWLTSPAQKLEQLRCFEEDDEIKLLEGLSTALLEPTVNTGIWRLNDDGPSLVHVACIAGQTGIYDHLVKLKPESKKWAAALGAYPAHCAPFDMIGHLKEGGAFSVQDDEYSATRMHWAAFHGEKNCAAAQGHVAAVLGKAGGHDPKDSRTDAARLPEPAAGLGREVGHVQG